MTTIQTVQDLIDLLSDFDPDAPVLIAHQPSWPLAEVVGDVTVIEKDEDDDDDDEEGYEDNAPDNTVWLVAGGHPHGRSPYAPKAVFEDTAW